jgi:CheY-like chemotaxis protein
MAKILIADDSRFQVQLMTSCLAPRGFVVVSAGDALQTWMKALREKPEAIVLDINMPGGTGIEVLKRLRISDKTRHIPVVVVSGSSEPNIETAVKNLGAHDFLHKPVDPDQLCEMLSRLLNPPVPQPAG